MTREVPILFSAPMIRALVDGRKSQTRRIQKEPGSGNPADYRRRWNVGDRLWVREGFAVVGTVDPGFVLYRANGYVTECGRHGFDKPYPPESMVRWRSPIHMPRWASRITLLVTDVRMQRLQDIAEDDALAEGAFKGKATGRIFNNATEMRLGGNEWRSARDWYADVWETIHGAGSWDINPWVWAITFEQMTP